MTRRPWQTPTRYREDVLDILERAGHSTHLTHQEEAKIERNSRHLPAYNCAFEIAQDRVTPCS